jgi:thermitase
MNRVGKTGKGRRSRALRLLAKILVIVPITLWFPLSSFSAEKSPSGKGAYVENEILVKFKDGLSDQEKAQTHGRINANRVKEFKIVRGLELVRIPRTLTVEEAIKRYEGSSEILYAEPNYIARTQVVPNDPSYGSLWGLQKIQ